MLARARAYTDMITTAFVWVAAALLHVGRLGLVHTNRGGRLDEHCLRPVVRVRYQGCAHSYLLDAALMWALTAKQDAAFCLLRWQLLSHGCRILLWDTVGRPWLNCACVRALTRSRAGVSVLTVLLVLTDLPNYKTGLWRWFKLNAVAGLSTAYLTVSVAVRVRARQRGSCLTWGYARCRR